MLLEATPPNATSTDDECPCSVIGPLLTAPGTSGRTWTCECGKEWSAA